MSQSVPVDHRATYIAAFVEGARARHQHLSEAQCRAIGEHLASQPHAALSTMHGIAMPVDDEARSDASAVGLFLWGLRRERPELFGEAAPADPPPSTTESPPTAGDNGETTP